MGSRFVFWVLGVYIATLLLLGSVGALIARVMVKEPPELYRNPAFDYALAPGWSCQTDGTEDVCYPAGTKPHSAIGVIAIKPRNDKDNLATYEAHLRTPQRIGDRDATVGPMSEVRYVKRRMLAGREWVEALHVGSEIADFHTYYLATTTSHIGMLVTLSVRKDFEARFTAEFRGMMDTLRTYQR